MGNHLLKISPNIIRVVSIKSKIGCHRFVVMASARLGNQILETNPKIVRVIPIMFKGGSHRKPHPAKQPKDRKKKTDPSSVNLSAIDLWPWTCQAGKPHPGKQPKNNKKTHHL